MCPAVFLIFQFKVRNPPEQEMTQDKRTYMPFYSIYSYILTRFVYRFMRYRNTVISPGWQRRNNRKGHRHVVNESMDSYQ